MKAIKQTLNCSVLGRREQRGSRTEGRESQGWKLGALGQIGPQPFFVNNVLLENNIPCRYIFSMAAIMVAVADD